MGLFKKKAPYLKMYESLKGSITQDMCLSNMVDSFEKMCHIQSGMQDDMNLFETGVFSFPGGGYILL